jgi:hypothetical protein
MRAYVFRCSPNTGHPVRVSIVQQRQPDGIFLRPASPYFAMGPMQRDWLKFQHKGDRNHDSAYEMLISHSLSELRLMNNGAASIA